MFIAKAVATALLVTSFGGLTSPDTQAAYQDKAKMESMIAACMKEQGLTYLPEKVIKTNRTKAEQARLAGDYEALRAYRAKYGFGVWSQVVYPNDPSVNPDAGESRNNRHLMSLSPAELKNWRAGQDKCFAKAAKSVLGKTVSSRADLNDKLNADMRKAVGKLDKDQQLAQLGKEFGACLQVSETKPTALAKRGLTEFRKQATEVARSRQTGPLPKALQGKDVFIKPNMTAEEAKPYLEKEVEAALADLECGKAFYKAYLPRERSIAVRVYQTYAYDFAL
ncbi:hypothetical protein [Nonomuraea rubra]|uniref:hypothetical protein n=1 Tax=Nonomuraea rubra TaxID=46180 RepID=UPI00340BB248